MRHAPDGTASRERVHRARDVGEEEMHRVQNCFFPCSCDKHIRGARRFPSLKSECVQSDQCVEITASERAVARRTLNVSMRSTQKSKH
jgi:CRISPR/Cas system-associated endoribonuclease Cas2